MANDLNQCTFTGRLGADPEQRQFQNGGQVVNLRIAVGEQWRDKSSGERKEVTEWINVAIFSDGLCKIAMDYLRKGSRVLIQGKFKTRKYQDQSGNDRYVTEIVLQGYDAKMLMLDGASGGQSNTNNQAQSDNSGWTGQAQQSGSSFDADLDLSDEVPF